VCWLQCAYILLAEVVIDTLKHAVLAKFNDIRSGTGQEGTGLVCVGVWIGAVG
jgi:hypothetical protein